MNGSHILSLIGFLVALFLVSRLLHERRPPGSALAWLLILLFFPYVGVPLYLLFGGRKLKRIPKESKTPLPPTDGNSLQLLPTGRDAYDALVREIREARDRIDVTTFILGSDPVARSILRELALKARERVRVSLLLDGLGSFRVSGPFSRGILREFHESGGRSAVFLPLLSPRDLGYSNLRNHRKLVVVDGRSAIVGGMNLSSDYMGEDSARCWTDLSILIRGPAARDFEDLFRSDWRFACGEDPRGEDPAPGRSPPERLGDQRVQLVSSGPDAEGDSFYDSIATAIFGAKRRIWIATPYFIPDETLSKGLELAARRGVDVRLVVPKRSNHFLADVSRGSYLRQLDRAGGRVHFFQGPGGEELMMHAKAVIVDDGYCAVGSANLDMRSLLLNFEAGVFVLSRGGIDEVASWFEALVRRAPQVHPTSSWGGELIEGLGRIFGPLL